MPSSVRDLVAPEKTALVLQELQNGVVGPGSALADLVAAAKELGVVEKAAALATAARAAGVVVVHATAENLPGGFGRNHNARLFAASRAAGTAIDAGSDSVRPVPELYEEGDVVLPRYQGLSPLAGTQLDALLRNAGITTIVIAGVSLNVAIPNFVFDAVNQSYHVVLARDAVAGVPIAYGEQVVQYTLKLLAELATTNDIVTAWSNPSTSPTP